MQLPEFLAHRLSELEIALRTAIDTISEFERLMPLTAEQEKRANDLSHRLGLLEHWKMVLDGHRGCGNCAELVLLGLKFCDHPDFEQAWAP